MINYDDDYSLEQKQFSLFSDLFVIEPSDSK